jgi:hypothetical protein
MGSPERVIDSRGEPKELPEDRGERLPTVLLRAIHTRRLRILAGIAQAPAIDR